MFASSPTGSSLVLLHLITGLRFRQLLFKNALPVELVTAPVAVAASLGVTCVGRWWMPLLGLFGSVPLLLVVSKPVVESPFVVFVVTIAVWPDDPPIIICLPMSCIPGRAFSFTAPPVGQSFIGRCSWGDATRRRYRSGSDTLKCTCEMVGEFGANLSHVVV